MKELLSLCCVLGVMVASQMASAAAEESRCHFNDEIWMQEANGGEGACIKAGDAFVTEDGQIIHARLPSEAPAEQDRLQIQVTSGQVEVDCGPKHIYDKIEGSCQPRPSKQPAEMPRRSSETETPSDTEKETTEVDCDEADDSCEAIETAAISGHDEDSTTEAGLPGIDMHLALTGVADGLPLTELEAIKNALLQPSPDDGSTPQLIEDSADVARALATETGSAAGLNVEPAEQDLLLRGLIFDEGKAGSQELPFAEPRSNDQTE